jgi:hypothetical protein
MGKLARGRYPGGMTAVRAEPRRERLAARPGRPVLVAGDLAELRGPVSGIAELPIWLFWCPDRTFDLDQPGMLRWMYQNVLREAVRAPDLTTYLNGGKLAEVWPELVLPREVRQAWEGRHPVLRARSAAPLAGAATAAGPAES